MVTFSPKGSTQWDFDYETNVAMILQVYLSWSPSNDRVERI